jgi:hypothetical protein
MMAEAQILQPAQRIAAGGDPAAPALVLASRSAARRNMLLRAGVPLIVDSAGVDEAEVKAGFRAEGATPDVLAALPPALMLIPVLLPPLLSLALLPSLLL